MINKTDIQDNEIRIIESSPKHHLKYNFLVTLAIAVLTIALVGSLIWLIASYDKPQVESIIEKTTLNDIPAAFVAQHGHSMVRHESINDVPMIIYTPVAHNVSLQIGKPETSEPDVIFTVHAADIREDNGGIVGEFMIQGEMVAQGSAKLGFCAIIDGEVSIGVGKETPLLQQAKDKKGYFFRQYPLVNNGIMVENKPKGKSIRRALAVLNNRIVVIESRSNESFHDFAQAIADLGCTTAINLRGSSSTSGWYRTEENDVVEFGNPYPDPAKLSNYIVWRK